MRSPPRWHQRGAWLRGQAEAGRLANMLAAFPTSEADDAALLARGADETGAPLDFHTRRIVEFRMRRKHALWRAPQPRRKELRGVLPSAVQAAQALPGVFCYRVHPP